MTPHPPQKTPAPAVYLETFGCQMNELDSELVTGQLRALGYTFTGDPGAADIVLYNTCSVREQAENKVLSRIGLMSLRKKAGESFILGVIGCMAERDGVGIMNRFPAVDILCGPGELDRLPRLIDNAMKTGIVDRADRVALQGNRNRRSTTLSAATDNLELLDLSRAFDPDRADSAGRSAYVRITRGCNKFCTYCVVPYTRGAEVHRPPQSIIDECKRLADAGVIEITLLGQTVNHYLYTHGAAVSMNGSELPQIGPGASAFQPANHGKTSQPAGRHTTTFADLLQRIHDQVPAIARLRFVTSYPHHFGNDILHVMAASPRICRYLHAPVQSGSDRILKLMNRGYTAAEYRDFIARARAILPDVCIGSDLIAGFPTETDADHQLTRDLVRDCGHKNNFIFRYSPRPGTTAFDRLTDDVPDAVKRFRVNDLLALQQEVSLAEHRKWVGRRVSILIESVQPAEPRDHPRPNGCSTAENAGNHGIFVQISLPGAASRNGHSNPQPPNHQIHPPGEEKIHITGRTPGDLIVSAVATGRFTVGSLAEVDIDSAEPLLLRGVVLSGEKSVDVAGATSRTASELVALS